MTLFENTVNAISLGSLDEIILDLRWALNPMASIIMRGGENMKCSEEKVM